MIDLDLLNDTEQWEQHCRQQQAKFGNQIQVVWNGPLAIDVDSLELQQQSHYADVHGTGVLAKQQVNPDAAILERTVIDPSEKVHSHLREKCKLNIARVSMNLQQPGMFIPEHYDKNRTLIKHLVETDSNTDWLDVKRFFYFFEDQEPGQFIQMGKTQLQWKAGDLVQWPYYLSHATANASYKPRKMLSIAGV